MGLSEPADSLQVAAERISKADAILVGAGAGMGVDSGLPDFRGNEGFWRCYPPFREKGLSFTDLANPTWFDHNPHQAWGFYGHRLNLYRNTKPHSGFSLLKKWGRNQFVFTSNVDGQFQMAGYAPQQIIEYHGSIHHLQCSRPCSDKIWNADKIEIDVDPISFLARDPFPRCPRCDAVARPNILMFGDAAWLPERTAKQMEVYSRWLTEQNNHSLVGIELGAGTAVPSVRQEMAHRTKGRQNTLIRINPRESKCLEGISIRSGALDALEILDKIICR
ncbi:MAG: hypothetical protein P1U77_28910 [Rubripirellula sp.]|jgi:NAD-dependent SIR2 family protein deacetylase|nr:hypothetical protein [Rubripirellula sp.]